MPSVKEKLLTFIALLLSIDVLFFLAPFLIVLKVGSPDSLKQSGFSIVV